MCGILFYGRKRTGRFLQESENEPGTVWAAGRTQPLVDTLAGLHTVVSFSTFFHSTVWPTRATGWGTRQSCTAVFGCVNPLNPVYKPTTFHIGTFHSSLHRTQARRNKCRCSSPRRFFVLRETGQWCELKRLPQVRFARMWVYAPTPRTVTGQLMFTIGMTLTSTNIIPRLLRLCAPTATV